KLARAHGALVWIVTERLQDQLFGFRRDSGTEGGWFQANSGTLQLRKLSRMLGRERLSSRQHLVGNHTKTIDIGSRTRLPGDLFGRHVSQASGDPRLFHGKVRDG